MDANTDSSESTEKSLCFRQGELTSEEKMGVMTSEGESLQGCHNGGTCRTPASVLSSECSIDSQDETDNVDSIGQCNNQHIKVHHDNKEDKNQKSFERCNILSYIRSPLPDIITPTSYDNKNHENNQLCNKPSSVPLPVPVRVQAKRLDATISGDFETACNQLLHSERRKWITRSLRPVSPPSPLPLHAVTFENDRLNRTSASLFASKCCSDSKNETDNVDHIGQCNNQHIKVHHDDNDEKNQESVELRNILSYIRSPLPDIIRPTSYDKKNHENVQLHNTPVPPSVPDKDRTTIYDDKTHDNAPLPVLPANTQRSGASDRCNEKHDLDHVVLSSNRPKSYLALLNDTDEEYDSDDYEEIYHKQLSQRERILPSAQLPSPRHMGVFAERNLLHTHTSSKNQTSNVSSRRNENKPRIFVINHDSDRDWRQDYLVCNYSEDRSSKRLRSHRYSPICGRPISPILHKPIVIDDPVSIRGGASALSSHINISSFPRRPVGSNPPTVQPINDPTSDSQEYVQVPT